jgi:uncharacterized protein YdeI (YjbR/CyaY-like superfamily)
MGKKDERVDDYIKKSAEFAKPILIYLRNLVHKACPEVSETIKWSFPHFEYKGVLCSMASFKQHCAFGFWKGALLSDSHKVILNAENAAMGHLGQIKNLADLPSDKILIEYIHEAKQLNDDGIKLPSKLKKKVSKNLTAPDYFRQALSKDKDALKTFEKLSPSHQREYIEWITEAKNDDTRNKRMLASIKWMSEGKSRNWKYLRK